MTPFGSAATGRGLTPRSAAAGSYGRTSVGSLSGESAGPAAASTRIVALPARPVRRPRGLRRLILVGVVGLLSFGLVAAGASSLGITASQTVPAQGTVTVSGKCVSTAGLKYTYIDDGGTTRTAASGQATQVSQIVIERSTGDVSCTGTHASIKFGNGSGYPTVSAGSLNPEYSSGTDAWTFALTKDATSNLLTNWYPGSITVTIY